MAKGCKCESGVGVVEKALKRCFEKYARFLTEHPLPFIIVPIVVTLLLQIGLMRYNYVYDSEYLYTPVNGDAKAERQTMEAHFPNNETNLYISTRKLDIEGFIQVILTDATSTNNIYTEEGLDATVFVDDVVKNYTTVGEHSGLNYQDVCSKWKGNCEENPIFLILDGDSSHNTSLSYPVHDGVYLGNQIGGVFLDADDVILTAEGIMLTYNVRYLDDEAKTLSSVWLNQVKDMLFLLQIPDISIILQTSDSLDEELDEATREIIPLFSATYTILCTFSLLTCMMLDWIRSKMWIALAGQVSAGLAIMSGIGLSCAAGIPFASICSTMPFLLMGIGIDNMFVIVAVWRDTPIRNSVGARMVETFSKAAVSITLTSLTDCLAFGIGALSPFRSVKFFCAYAGISCAFCYVYSITFLAACMVYSGHHEEQNRHIVTCTAIDPVSVEEKLSEETDWTLRRIFCWGSAVEHTEPDTEPLSATNQQPAPDYPGAIPEKVQPYAVTFMEQTYACYLLKSPSKILVFISYLIYLGFAIWGCTQLQEGLDLQNLAPDDSYLVDFYDTYDPLFSEDFSGRIMVAMTEALDYTDTTDLNKINDLVKSFQNDDHFYNDTDLLEFWLYDYETFLESASISPSNMTHFIYILQNNFLQIPGYDRYYVDLEFNGDNTEITASRFLIQAKGCQSTTEESELMLQSRALAEQSQISTTVYFNAFIYWDQYVIVLFTTMTNLSIAVVCVLVVSFFLVPSINAVILVALSIASICVGVVGYMTFWDVNLDSVSMINLILCIGFSVDFTAHICYHFSISSSHVPNYMTSVDSHNFSSSKLWGSDNQGFDPDDPHIDNKVTSVPKADDLPLKHNIASVDFDVPKNVPEGDQKATEVLAQLGMPITQGALSTILAVSVLAASNTYIFRTFFKVIFLVMCFGFYHAMVLLPVVLSSLHDCCCKTGSSRSNSHIWPSTTNENNEHVEKEMDNLKYNKEKNTGHETTVKSDAASTDSGISSNSLTQTEKL